MANNSELENYLKPGIRVHLSGIGGVSMCALADVLKGKGLHVQGSDISRNDNVNRLISEGIDVAVGHSSENLKNCDLVIRSAAIKNENPEIAGAMARGIPVFERAQAWGAIMKHYDNAICISGTHGKTTTTSMVSHIFMKADKDPTIMLGGNLSILNGNGYRVGNGDSIILESCEYCNSFLNFFPTAAVILNVAADHLDFFKDIDDIKHSFRKFAQLVPEYGFVVYNQDDANASEALSGIDRTHYTFSVSQSSATAYAKNIRQENGYNCFTLVIDGHELGEIQLNIPGQHNISNSLAAALVSYKLGCSFESIQEGLVTFYGAARRFEKKGTFHDALIYDDYAHHPDEIHALLSMAKEVPHKRLICVFQPHTYSRTVALFDEFIKELQTPDITVLAEIYAAREKNDNGVSSKQLQEHIPHSVYCSTLSQVSDTLREMIQPGDLVITVGAGDIYKVSEELCR